jgi:hypothetical protein
VVARSFRSCRSLLGYFTYYGVPILGGNTDHFTSNEILEAALTVGLFLAMAALSWSSIGFRRRLATFEVDRELNLDVALPRIVLSTLIFGLVFEIGLRADIWASLLGTALGTFRSLAMSTMAVGCFLFGTAIGRGRLSGTEKFVNYLLLAASIMLDISGLIMHTGIVLVAAVLIGFVISSKRVPWIALVVVVTITALLHGSERVERERYWTASSPDISIMDTPALLVEWLSAGFNQIQNANSEDNQALVDRASQLTVLLLVEEQTPRNIPYLGGTTYANFPNMLIPRFLSPDKITSQTNLNLLSVRYGMQGKEDTATTTIAWNLVPEAYANFGYFGVAVAGLVFGLMVGGLTWFTSGAPPISLRGLVGLAALVTLLDVEYDFSYLLLNLLQTMFSISVFFVGIKALEMLLGVKTLEKPPEPLRSTRSAGRAAR